MANDVVPETTWGPRSFGLADQRIVQVQIKYATQQLGYPVWGMSPSSTADDTGDYSAFGAQGLAFPTGEQLAQGPCPTCTPSPEIDRDAARVVPRAGGRAAAGLREHRETAHPVPGDLHVRRRLLRRGQPDDRRGRPPPTGARSVDDHGRSLDNALDGGQMQRWFAADPVSSVARIYLGAETMSLQ